jgi:antirestriction protein ArdC
MKLVYHRIYQFHASYIKSWIEALKDDKRAIFRAAADAQKIADYLLAFHPALATASDDIPDDDEATETNSPMANAA